MEKANSSAWQDRMCLKKGLALGALKDDAIRGNEKKLVKQEGTFWEGLRVGLG